MALPVKRFPFAIAPFSPGADGGAPFSLSWGRPRGPPDTAASRDRNRGEAPAFGPAAAGGISEQIKSSRTTLGTLSEDRQARPRPAAGAHPQGGGRASFGLSFEVLAQIALGSTARVDLCRSLGPRQTGQLIAVKRLLPDLVNDETIGKRFLDEVWMTAALRHPNVVGVVGWGHDALGPYLAVELVQGVSLARLARNVFETGEQFPERLVVYIALAVARGLAAAHDLRSERGELLNLVHRDLSGANVLASFHGEVKIADFGLAKAKDRLTVTTSELPSRTMSHVAPEELEQRPVDRRSDLFGFGVMLFELLCGRGPFTGKDELAVLEAVLKKRAPDPLSLRPKLDPAVGSLVLRCLEKDPAARPQSAHEVARELEAWLYNHGYLNDSQESLSRFVRRNSMRQMRWFERVIAGLPEPAPAPFAPRQPSLYPLGDARSPAGASAVSARENEATVVAGRRAAPPPPRRSRSSDALAAVAGAAATPPPPPRSRRRDGARPSDPPPAAPVALHTRSDIPSMVDDEQEDAPTVALKVDKKMRDAVRDLAGLAPRAETRATLETVRMEDVETTQDPTLRKQPPAAGTPPLVIPSPAATQRLGPQTAEELAGLGVRPRKPAITEHVENELATLRELAMARHDQVKRAREAAHRAAIEADQAEAQARVAERAIAGARAALDLALRGDAAGAQRKLDDALALVRQKPS